MFIIIVVVAIILIEIFGIDANTRKIKKQNEEIVELLKQLNNK